MTFFCLCLFLFLVLTSKLRKDYPLRYMNNFIDFLQQPDDITCGPTSTAMLLRFYSKNVSIEEVKKITKTVWFSYDGKDFGMTAPELIRNALDHYGCNAILSNGFIKDLKRVLSKGKPCIVLVRSGEYSWHYIVVVGYNEEMIFYANPSDGNLSGLSEYEFTRAWNWNGDLSGRDCSWWISFWLKALEIYPYSYIYCGV